MVMVRGSRESVYEVACFLLKSNAEEKGLHDTDMLSEAEQIIKNCSAPVEKSKDQMRRRLLGARAFVLGGMSGAGLFWLLSFLG